MDHEKIAVLAYEIYEHRIAHNLPGDALQDWYEAEHVLAHRHMEERDREHHHDSHHDH